MAFEFKPDESVKKGIRRIVRAQLKKAHEELKEIEQTSGPGGADDPVHSVRKRFKRLRAVCRLVRNELGEKTYQRENYRFRDAGKPLTEVRDSEVLLETLGKLVEESDGRLKADEVSPVRRGLKANHDQVVRRILQQADTIADIIRTVEQAQADLDDWKIGHNGWPALRPGLKQGYQRCQDAGAAAAADGSVENLHEWRKQAKYFWHELQLIAPANRDVLEPMADAVHELTKRLGDDHDLAVLKQMVTERSTAYGGEPMVEKLLPPIADQRAKLQKEAFEFQRQLFRQTPKAFLDQAKQYWKEWRTADKFVRVG